MTEHEWWLCVDCGHEFGFKEEDHHMEKCSKCNSKKIKRVDKECI